MVGKSLAGYLCLAVGLTLAPTDILFAGTPVRAIPASRAQGIYGEIVKIKLSPGYGVNLNFRPTGEFVRRATLGDPSKATLSFDDPNCRAMQSVQTDSSSSSREENSSCRATLIYLRPIDQLKIPGIPTAPSTLLTVTTDNNLYHFLVTYAQPKSPPEYFTVTIQPDVTQKTSLAPNNSTTSTQLKTFQSGLQVAIDQGYITNDDEIASRITNFLTLISVGREISEAASQSGVSIKLVFKLAELGRQQSVTNSIDPF